MTALLARWTEKLAGGPLAGRSDSPTSKGQALLARWTEKLAGGPLAGRSDFLPLARVKGVGRQQQRIWKINSKSHNDLLHQINHWLPMRNYALNLFTI